MRLVPEDQAPDEQQKDPAEVLGPHDVLAALDRLPSGAPFPDVQVAITTAVWLENDESCRHELETVTSQGRWRRHAAHAVSPKGRGGLGPEAFQGRRAARRAAGAAAPSSRAATHHGVPGGTVYQYHFFSTRGFRCCAAFVVLRLVLVCAGCARAVRSRSSWQAVQSKLCLAK